MRTIQRALVIVAATALVTTGLMAAPAQGAVTVYTQSAIAESMLDTDTGGAYVDNSGRVVTTVTTPSAAAQVRAKGGVALLVKHSAAQLNRIVTDLDPRVAGTAWSVDPATNQVVVDIDETVVGAKLASVEAAVARAGGAARIERMRGVLSRTIAGGHAIYTGGSRCSLGFNVRSGSTYYFITAGHCTNIGSTWRDSSGVTIGTRTGTSFPGNDYGIVRYNTSYTNHPGSIANGQDIASAGNAVVGQAVRRHGSTTGNRGGTVTGLNATVNYPQGTVTGMIRTNVCAQGGDSGGPLYAGSVALGLTSGGSGNCTSGGTTFFQPVLEVLNRYSVSVY